MILVIIMAKYIKYIKNILSHGYNIVIYKLLLV